LQTAAVTGAGVVLDPIEGLGILERQLADCYDGVGVIHLPVELLGALNTHNLIERHGAQLRTTAGNLVALGAGYPGTGPSGQTTSGALWVYATGAVFAYRSDIRSFPKDQSFDRDINTVKAVAERTYLLGWDCCHFGVPITTAGEPEGTVGED
jgi:hypothetical protein